MQKEKNFANSFNLPYCLTFWPDNYQKYSRSKRNRGIMRYCDSGIMLVLGFYMAELFRVE